MAGRDMRGTDWTPGGPAWQAWQAKSLGAGSWELESRASNSEQPTATNDSTDSTAACSTFPNSAVGGDIRLVFAWFCTLLGSTPQSTSNGIQPRPISPNRLQKDTSRR